MGRDTNTNQFLDAAPSVTRYKITNYAMKKLQNRELESTSIRDLCNELAISRVTFYYHFNNKQHLTDELIRIVQENGVASMRGKDYGEAIVALVKHISENKNVFRNILIKRHPKMNTIAFSRILVKIIEREFERQRREGREIDFNVNLAAIFVTGGIVYILTHWVSDGYKLSSKEIEDCLLGEFKGRTSLFAAMASANLK